MCLYKPAMELKPHNLNGISNAQVDDHWKLYEGYVKQVNAITEDLKQMRADGLADTMAYNDRRRRHTFEHNGMVLHEYYFAAMKSDSPQDPVTAGLFKQEVEKQWDSMQTWQEDFIRAGMSRGAGWGILYVDLTTGFLSNQFITEQQNGHLAGFAPILTLDVWDHAYMVDHGSGGRADYIKAFMANTDWELVQRRLEAALEGRPLKRY
jgi:Fe-Mn family superoxide dismutase